MSDKLQEPFRIIGIVLVRNEEFFIRTALENILPACDEIHVFDHGSKDQTFSILSEVSAREPKVRIQSIQSPEESHQAIEKFAGTRTWIFAVDGDEIYDPERTKAFCDRLRGGEFSEVFQLRGNVLHVDEWSGDEYAGFLAPPSRAMTKMFNFSRLSSWTGGFERLHGGEQVFKSEVKKPRRYALSDEFDFNDSPFRCLHLVFLRRSSREKEGSGPRMNIADRLSQNFVSRLKHRFNALLGRTAVSDAKYKNYALGGHVRIADPSFRIRRENIE